MAGFFWQRGYGEENMRFQELLIKNKLAKGLLTLMLFVLWPNGLSAQIDPLTSSDELITQFQALPPSLQQSIARDMGIEDALNPSKSVGVEKNEVLADVPNNFPIVEVQGSSSLTEVEDPNRIDNIGLEMSGPSAWVFDRSIKKFGQQLFDKNVTTFAPTDTSIVPNDYKLGVGDNLIIHIYGQKNSKYSLQINREGVINIPQLGPVEVAGLSIDQGSSLINRKISSELIGVTSFVSMGRLRAINVFLAGDVSTPGSYSVSALSTVSQALYLAGGLSDVGALRDIQVKRGGSVVARFDAYDLLLKGDSKGDIKLEDGDVIFVPIAQRVAQIRGAVQRPGSYEVLSGDSLFDLLNLAGGPSADVFSAGVTLVRYKGSGLPAAVRQYNLSDQSLKHTRVENGDVLILSSVGSGLTNFIELSGAVHRPGYYGLHENAKITDYLTDVTTDLTLGADLKVSLLERYDPTTGEVTVFLFPLEEILSNPASKYNFTLRDRDRLTVFDRPGISEMSRADQLEGIVDKLAAQSSVEEPTKVFKVEGAVKEPGLFPMPENTTLREAVLLAGGFRDDANLSVIEIARSIVTPSGEVDVTYIKVPGAELGKLNVPIKSRDNISIRVMEDLNKFLDVELVGEFVYPGVYPIQNGESLFSVIERAGGLTSKGFLDGMVVTRESVLQREDGAFEFQRSRQSNELLDAMLTDELRTGLNPEAFLRLKETIGSKNDGRIVLSSIDLTADTFQLQDGDKIYIPQTPSTVTVSGAVHRPASFKYDPSLQVFDYLDLAAGLMRRADKKNVYVIHANGSIDSLRLSWLRFEAPLQILPGDIIVVPINSSYRPLDELIEVRTRAIFQTLISAAAVGSAL